MSRRWRNWCQNEVYEETKEADSRDKVHNGRSGQLFLEDDAVDDYSVEIPCPVMNLDLSDHELTDDRCAHFRTSSASADN